MNRLKNFEEKNQQAYMSQYWKKTKVLYFMANRASKVEDVDQKMLRGVPDSYLTKTFSYSKENGEKVIKSFVSYKAQFSQEPMDKRANVIRTGDYMVYFKPLIPPKKNRIIFLYYPNNSELLEKP